MDIPRTAVGSPYRLLDTKQRKVRTDKTYELLAGLASTVGKGFSAAKDDSNFRLERQARNDLVNETVNEDLALHEEAYASVIIQGQAERQFIDMKTRLQSGEFDNMTPADYQQYMNDIHKEATDKYKGTQHYERIHDTYNKFWVNNEAVITAGHAGRHRVVLKNEQGTELVKNTLTRMAQPGVTKDDILESLYDPDYSLLTAEDRVEAAFNAAVITSAQGDFKTLEAFDTEFGFSENPKYSKQYAAAHTASVKKKKSIDADSAMRLRLTYEKKVEEGLLEANFFDNLKDVLGPDGRPIVPFRTFAQDLVKSSVNNIKVKNLATAKTNAEQGIDISNIVQPKDFQSITSTHIAKVISDYTQSLSDRALTIGKYAGRQTSRIDMLASMGTSYAAHNIIMKDGKPNPMVTQGFVMMQGIRAGMNNDPKFFRSIGDGAAARYKLYEHATKTTIGTPEDKAQNVAITLEEIEKKVATGTNRKIMAVSKSTRDDAADAAEKIFKKNDAWYAIDPHRETSVGAAELNDFILAQTKYNVNFKGLSDESALELAISEADSIFVNFDDNMSNTYGASYDFGDTNENVAEALRVNAGIKAVVANHQGLREPDMSKVRMKLSFEDESIVMLDDVNNVVLKLPMEQAKIMNNGLRMGADIDVDFSYVYSDAVQNTRQGKEAATKHKIANDSFNVDIVNTEDNDSGITPTAWYAMTEQTRTEARVNYYREHVLSATGFGMAVSQITQGIFPTGIKVLADSGVKKFQEILRKVKKSTGQVAGIGDTLFQDTRVSTEDDIILYDIPEREPTSNIQRPTTPSNFKGLKVGKAAIKHIESMEGKLTPEQRRVVELEGYIPGIYMDSKGIETQGVGQTGSNIGKSFKEVFTEHEQDLVRLIPSYTKQSLSTRKELMQAMYRGDIQGSPKFRALFNAGKYKDAAKEFLNNDEYKSKNTKAQIKRRMKAVADAVKKIKDK